jgi:hypothetical protein
MRDTVATNTFEKVIEKMTGVIANNGALDQTALETLAIGAVAVKAKAEADKTATAAATVSTSVLIALPNKLNDVLTFSFHVLISVSHNTKAAVVLSTHLKK